MEALGFGLLAIGLVWLVIAMGRSMWRQSERQHQRWQARRGEDEPEERFDDRGDLRRHWGGWGRPGR